MKKNNKKFTLLILIFIVAVLSGLFLKKTVFSSGRQLTKVCDYVFVNELSSDALNLHFSLANPEKYGFNQSPPLLRSYLKEERIKQNIMLENAIEQLNAIHTERLNEQEKLTYRIVSASLKGSLEGEKYVYFLEPFSPTGGIQSEYPLLLAEYAFRCEEDVKNYLELLKLTPSYFQSFLAFEKERLQAGFCLSDENADLVIATCDEFASSCPLLIQTFEDKLKDLMAQGILDSTKASSYQKENEKLVTEIVMKAYEELADGILLLKGNAAKETGLYYKPEGKDYYCYLLRESIGTDKSPDELKKMLNQKMKDDILKLQNLLKSADVTASSHYTDPLKDMKAKDILSDLKMRISKDFPLLDTKDYTFMVHTVDETLEKYTAPAYYFTPPIDALYENNIYVNQSSTGSGLDLYTTLAHEGFPGHLYQSVTTQTGLQMKKVPHLRNILNYGGYTEGFATYAEMYSYSYAKECAKELSGNEDTFLYYDILKLDRSIKLGLYSTLDIMIHYEGKKVTDVAEYLKKFGITDRQAAESIYDYIVNEPTNYLKYFVGYLEILECKELAEHSWGKDYSDARFHSFLMEIGPAPFQIMKEQILYN